MVEPTYLIPIGEGRLMHLAGDEVPRLIDHARREAIGTAEELASFRQKGIIGQVLPALVLDGCGWNFELDGATRRGGDAPEAVFERAFLGGWPIGDGPNGPAAHALWAEEVRAVASELRVALRPQVEAFNCLHGAISRTEEPGAVVGEGHFRSGNRPEPLRFDWIIGGREIYALDRPTFDRLVAELRFVADFYDLAAECGFALIVASIGTGAGDEEHDIAPGDHPALGPLAEK